MQAEPARVDLRVPTLGESLTEATVGSWLKQEGDILTTGEPVVELETEKVNLQVSADASGVLERIVHPAGDVVHVGDVLGIIQSGANVPASPQPKASPTGATPTQIVQDESPRPMPTPTPPTSAEETPLTATPVARRVAAEHGIELDNVAGTGPGGRVTREDVEAYLQRQRPEAQNVVQNVAQNVVAPPPRPVSPPPPPDRQLESAPLPSEVAPLGRAERPEERVRLSRRRLTIARRLVEAQQTEALLTTFNEIDMSAVIDLRKRRREAFQQRHGVGLGFMSFFVKASVAALKAFPNVNAELSGDELILKRYYDIGIAVDTEGGLVVPIVRNADRRAFAEIEQEIADLAKRARESRLSLEDLRGGTFTITNGGVFGSLFSTPIVNPPQVGILGMHRIVERPVAVNGQVEIRPMMYIALTYDHRVIDGRTAVQFLVRIKELIEDPEALLLEG
jgi:2-oxoglutarate dehydrogenase E2 component (dihydrolipoamide succinyltransferase)